MVFSQGWRHFKINKAQVPHPGRPWQMRVIHSLAQLLRDPSQAGKAVPGSSPSDADEMHSRRKGRRREGDSCGEFQTVLLELPSLPGSLTFSEAGDFKATSKPKWVQMWIRPEPHHSFRIFGSWSTTMATLFMWSTCMVVQGQGTQECCGMRGKLPVLYPALSTCYKESYDALWNYMSPLYTTCEVNLSLFISNSTPWHNKLCESLFSTNSQNIQYSNVRYHRQ